jgi:HEAT repeat protein
MTGMEERTQLQEEVERVIAYSGTVSHDSDDLFEQVGDLVRRDPAAAMAIGESLMASSEIDRLEMAVRLVGVAAELDRPTLRARALPTLRRVLEANAEPGPLSWAILELGHLADEHARDAILVHARHSESQVRHAVAFALPACGLDDSSLAALCDLSQDEDEDVRDWATFGLGELTDADSPAIRDALIAHVEDSDYETRIEAIIGLARRQDERVRPHLVRELADPDHAEMLDDATDYLDNGTGRIWWEEDPEHEAI